MQRKAQPARVAHCCFQRLISRYAQGSQSGNVVGVRRGLTTTRPRGVNDIYGRREMTPVRAWTRANDTCCEHSYSRVTASQTILASLLGESTDSTPTACCQCHCSQIRYSEQDGGRGGVGDESECCQHQFGQHLANPSHRPIGLGIRSRTQPKHLIVNPWAPIRPKMPQASIGGV